jgi:hypothetical protein
MPFCEEFGLRWQSTAATPLSRAPDVNEPLVTFVHTKAACPDCYQDSRRSPKHLTAASCLCVFALKNEMTFLNPILILSFAFLAVFFEATLSAPRQWLGAQIDLLPALMIYAALRSDIVTVSLLAMLGGMWFDSFSANPLGISILPLFVVGYPIYLRRELILRDLPFAQVMLGTAASALVPALTLLLLLNGGKQPLIGWGSLWQWIVMTAGGAAATPVIFALFEWGGRTLGYRPHTEMGFRPDREIRHRKILK